MGVAHTATFLMCTQVKYLFMELHVQWIYKNHLPRKDVYMYTNLFYHRGIMPILAYGLCVDVV